MVTVNDQEVATAHHFAIGRGGSSVREPRPSKRRNAAVVTRNDGRPRPPNRGSSVISPRASSVSITPLLSVARIWPLSSNGAGSYGFCSERVKPQLLPRVLERASRIPLLI